ncbi:hypothetical protein NRL14_16930 [Pseudoalteromonas sp. 20-92]|uniref:hypothetical protein n=1 Tax=Pseudoalteromonas sp. 20-92 TaxID=2969394 RepID=UPI0027B30D8B|nr:hypothetical protein [Pseudoalteromonas sp. 20-92]MDQ2045389.1 hypothetical protein [Pseudoalteromonas sp. 20-92]
MITKYNKKWSLQKVAVTLLLTTTSNSFSIVHAAENKVSVDVNLDTKHRIGNIERFNREKFISLHSAPTENEWDHDNKGNNAKSDLIGSFINGYDVYFGRDTGYMKNQLFSQKQDSNRLGFIDESVLTTKGNAAINSFENGNATRFVNARRFKNRSKDMVVGGQVHPYYPDGTNIGNSNWAFSQKNTNQEPIGTATGHYMGQFLQKYFAQTNTAVGAPKPAYLEVVNEPLYDLNIAPKNGRDKAPIAEIFKYHKSVAQEIRKTNNQTLNKNINVAGYTVAFPNYDWDNFERWESNDKLFIDTAGADMDVFSIHLYDFPTHPRGEEYRRGSNVEATLDMLEQYSNIKFGRTKPLLISEYGASVHALRNKPWSQVRDAEKLRGYNALLTHFLERPDVIAKAIPFIPVKAEWGRHSDTGYPYENRLMRQQFENAGQTGTDWIYTDLVKFFQLWSEVKGIHVDSWASDLDIMVDAYVQNNKAHIIMTSLEFQDTDVALKALGNDGNTIKSVQVKTLSYDNNNHAKLATKTMSSVPKTVSLPKESTQIMTITYHNKINIDKVNQQNKYYATTYKQPIKANVDIYFNIKDVEVGAQGEAVLRLGIGREHGKSLTPIVNVNNVPVEVPTDFRGYDQKQGKTRNGRASFFGVIEIPVSHDLLQGNNWIRINFDDAGGFITSAALQVVNSSDEITRSL